jgi:hypothetical protein
MTAQNIEQDKAELLSRVRKYIDEAPRALSRFSRNLERFTKSQPLLGTLAALTAGFLVARVLARR